MTASQPPFLDSTLLKPCPKLIIIFVLIDMSFTRPTLLIFQLAPFFDVLDFRS